MPVTSQQPALPAFLRSLLPRAILGLFAPRPGRFEIGTYYGLVPSRTTPGDWDLVRHYFWTGSGRERPPYRKVPRLKQPSPSFLHRVDDRHVVDYFSSILNYHNGALTSEEAAARLFEIGSALFNSQPDDLYIGALYLDALLRKGDYETLESRITALKEAYSRAADPFLREAFQMAEHALHAKQLTDAGRNAYNFATKVLASDYDLTTRLKEFPDILHYEDYAVPLNALISPTTPTNFLAFQISLKVFQVEAFFLMLQGRREDALKLLAASYHLGQLLNQCGPMAIATLIGSAFRSLACRGLRIYTLNCCETPDEFKHVWEVLEELNRRSQDIDLAVSPSDVADLYGIAEMIERTGVSHRRADTEFQLVRMATAAKYRFVTQQEFPRSADEFAPLLPDGPPQDPFTTAPLRFFSSPQSFTCYSVGPDEQDNRAAVSYDPTNGTVSRGDIILEIPHERKYPFPREGVRAASADELRRQFPNGLPRDLFADTRGRPLGISNTIPVYIYSYGPDTDESEARKVSSRYVPEAHYDPTNGLFSPGDLFIAIPLGP